jgi:hypothetical protein
MDQVTLTRAAVQQVLEALEGGGDSWRLIGPAIDALRAALEQPEQEPVADRAAFERHAESLGYSVDPDTRAGREGGYWSSHTHLMWETWQAALEQPQQEPVALREVALIRDTNGMCVVTVNGREVIRDNGDIISHYATLDWFAHPPRRDPLTVTDLQQALVDADLVDPDAIDDPEGFDNGFTLQQIDALHSRLMQTTPPTTTTQPEPK